MKTAQMAATLRHLVPVLEKVVGDAQARILVRTADAIDLAGKTTLGALDTKLKKSLGEGASGPAADAIAAISNVFAAAGCATPSKDFTAVASILRRLNGLDAEGVFKAINAALAPPPPKPAKAKAPPFDAREVADRLTAASANNAAFDALFIEVSKLSKPKLESVAEKYLGYQRAYKSKPEVLKAIRARQFQDAIEEGRDRRISKIAV